MRGKVYFNVTSINCFGITPAHAGKSCDSAEPKTID